MGRSLACASDTPCSQNRVRRVSQTDRRYHAAGRCSVARTAPQGGTTESKSRPCRCTRSASRATDATARRVASCADPLAASSILPAASTPVSTHSPATTLPRQATTIERCPAATSARSIADSTCSAPPTASGPTGASAYATLTIVSLVRRFSGRARSAGSSFRRNRRTPAGPAAAPYNAARSPCRQA